MRWQSSSGWLKLYFKNCWKLKQPSKWIVFQALLTKDNLSWSCTSRQSSKRDFSEVVFQTSLSNSNLPMVVTWRQPFRNFLYKKSCHLRGITQSIRNYLKKIFQSLSLRRAITSLPLKNILSGAIQG